MRTAIYGMVIWSIVCLTAGMSAETDPAKIVEEGIRQFYRDAASDDEKVRAAAIKNYFVDEATLTKLIGKEDGARVWAVISKRLEDPRMVAALKNEIGSKGAVKEIKLIDLRQDPNSADKVKWLAAEIPIYRAVITTDKTTAGSSAYVVIDNKVRHFQGLDRLPEMLKNLPK